MEIYIYWFLLAFGLLMLEMATGTFYMLMLSAAFGVGGIAALAGFGLPMQMTLGAVVSIVGILILRHRSTDTTSQELDIGQSVQVVAWREDGTARVRYRGAEWDAEPESAGMSRDGAFCIKEIHGSRLVLTRKP